MGKKVRIERLCVYIVAVLSLFSFFFASNAVEAYVPGDTITHGTSHSYNNSTYSIYGSYYVGVAIHKNGSVCDQQYGNVYGSNANPPGPASISASCSQVAGPVGTTYTFKNFLLFNGSWSSTGETTYTVVAPTCTTFTYSGWGACQSDNTQTRTVTGSSPAGCTGGSPVTSQSCTFSAPACNYTYSNWGACQPNGTQTRTVNSTSPSGCAGTPATSQSCTYVAAVASAGLSLATPSSMPVPYNSAATLAVSSQNASNCNLSGGGQTWSNVTGNVGAGNVGVGNLTTDTAFSVNCTPNANTTGTPSNSLTVTVAAQVINYTISSAAGTGGTRSCTGCGTVSSGSQVSVTASPNTNYQFSSWSWSGTNNPCSSAGSTCTWNAAQSGTLTANFTAVPSFGTPSFSSVCNNQVTPNDCSTPIIDGSTVTYSGSVTNSGGAAGTWNGTVEVRDGNSGTVYTNWISGVSATVAANTTATLSGTHSNDATFGAGPWQFRFCQSGGSCSPWSGNYYFTKGYSISTTASPSAGGSIACSVGGTTVPCSNTFQSGTEVALTASTAANYQFSNWSGDCSGSSCLLTMNGNRSVTANFSSFNYRIDPPAAQTITQGKTIYVYVPTTLTGGNTEGVTLTLSNLQNGVSYTVDPVGALNPSVTRVFAITAAGNATVETRTVTITGSPLGRTTTFSLSVLAPTVSATLTARNAAGTAVTAAQTGETLNFTTSVLGTAGGTATYSGHTCGSGANLFNVSDGSFSCTYTSASNKTASITVTKQGVSATATKVISVTAPPNTLIIQSVVIDGAVITPTTGASMEMYDGTYNGIYPTEKTFTSTTGTITNTIQAPSKLNGNSFLSWSGCDSTRSRQRCDVTVANGATKTINAQYVTASYYRPNFTVSGVVVNGDKYKGTSTYVDYTINDHNVTIVGTITNSGSTEAPDQAAYVSFEYSTNGGASYTAMGAAYPAIKEQGGSTIPASFPRGAQQRVYAVLDVPPGAYTLRICVDSANSIPETNDSDNCSGGTAIVVSTPSAPPTVQSCFASFVNTNTAESNRDVRTSGNVGISGNCSTDYFQGMTVTGTAYASDLGAGVPVLDLYGWFGWRDFGTDPTNGGNGVWRDTGPVSTSAQYSVREANGACQNSSGWPSGDGIGFGPINVSAGYSNSFTYASYLGCLQNDPWQRTHVNFGTYGVPWGIYNYGVTNTFSGTYYCYVHLNSVYDVPSDTFKTPVLMRGDPKSFNLSTRAESCYSIPRGALDDDYYQESCGNSKYTDSVTFSCPGYTATPVQSTSNPLPLPNTPILKRHTLNVKSTFGTESSQGVFITQVGSAYALKTDGTLTSSVVVPMEGGNFGGTTDYSKTTERNFRVTLKAPFTHPSRGGSFIAWSGCDSLATSGDAPAGVSNNQCTIDFKYSNSGGISRTITANYFVAVPAQPIISVGPGSCGANVNISWSAAAGATTYKLHRSTNGLGGPFNQLPIGIPTTVTSVYPDSKLNATTPLSPNTEYWYQLEAVNTGGSSFSPITSGLSSKNCFDFGLTNGGNKTTVAGTNPVDNTLTASLTPEAVGATTQVVNLTMGSLPAGVTHVFLKGGVAVTSITPNDTITVRLNTTLGTTLPNTYAITITGTSPNPKIPGQNLTRQTTYNLIVTNPSNMQLSVTKSGTGTGTVKSSEATPKINCGSTCSALYTYSDQVTLIPTPDAGSAFKQWTGACSWTGSCIVNMNGNKAVDAEFTKQIASVDLKAETSDGPIIVDYDFNPKLTWSSTFVNANSCNITIDRQSNNFPKNGQPASMTAPGISTEALRQDVTFTVTCTKNTGAGGGTGTTVTDSVVVKVKVRTGDVTPVTRANSCGVIDVTYQSAGNATTYTLHRNPDASGLNQWGRIAGGGTEATGVAFGALPAVHTGLTAGTLYQYQLQAFNKVSDASSPIRSATASANCFDYTLSNSGNVGVGVTGAASASVTKTLVTAPTQAVTLAVSSIKKPDNSIVTGSGSSLSTSGLTIAIRDNNPSNPTSTSNIDVTTNNATLGTYVVTVVGSPLGKSTSFNVTVSIGQPTVTLNTTTAACGANINLSYGGGSGANSFTLYRQIDSNTSPYPQRATAPTLAGLPTIDKASDSLIAGRTYWYQLKASNGSFDAYSPRVSAVASVPCPTIDLKINDKDSDTVAAGSNAALSWQSFNAPTGSTCLASSVPISTFKGARVLTSSSPESVVVDVNTTYKIDCLAPGDYPFSDTAVVTAPVTVTCSALPTSGTAGVTEITWTAVPKGGTGAYTYSWSGTDSLTGTAISVKKTYGATSAGSKTASVSVNGLAAANCSTPVNIIAPVATADIKADASDGPITVNYGATPTISWSSEETATCSITASPGVTGFPKSGTSSAGVTSGALTADTTFNILCTPANGATNNPTNSVVVKVRPQAPDLTALPAACGGNINLTYTESNNTTGYKLHRNPYSGNVGTWGQIEGGNTGISIATLRNNRAIDVNLALGASYQYQLEAVNTNGSANSAIRSTNASEKCFDYSLSNGGNISVTAGQSVTNQVTRTLAPGVPVSASQDVTLSVGSLPNGMNAPDVTNPSFTANPFKPANTSTLTLNTTLGKTCLPPLVSCTYLVTVTGVSAGITNKTTTFNLTVNNPSYLLTLNRSGNGSVSSSPVGVTCNTGCATTNASYLYNTSVVLTATPDSGWVVDTTNWTGCDSVTSNQGGQTFCTVKVTAAKTVAVLFTQVSANVNLKASASDGPITLAYGSGANLTWTSNHIVDNTCGITAIPSATGFPKSSLPLSHSGTSYTTGNLTVDTTFRITCTKITGAGGTDTDTVLVKVGPEPVSFNAAKGSCGSTIDLTSYSGGAGATGNAAYTLYRQLGDNPPYPFVESKAALTGGGGLRPVDSVGLTSGSTYFYQVMSTKVHLDTTSSYSYSAKKSAVASEKCFDYSLSNNGNVTIAVGGSSATAVTKTLVAGATAPVTLSVTSITAPGGTVTTGSGVTLAGSGLTVTVANNNPSNPATNPATNPSTVNVTSTTNASVGNYTVVVTGAPLGKTTSFAVTVNASAPTISFTPTPFACGGNINLFYGGGNGAARFSLFRKIDSNTSPYDHVETVTSRSALRTVDAGLIPGRTYYYQVRAWNGTNTTNEAYSVIPTSAVASEKCFDYSLSNGGNVSVTAGQSVTNTVTRTLASGVPVGASQDVTLSAVLPGTMNAPTPTFTLNPSKPTSTSNITLSTTLGTTCPPPTASCTYLITVNGSPLSKSTTFNLTVNNPSYALTITTSGTGEGSVTTSGITPAISCNRTNGTTTSGTCTGTYLHNTLVTLSASPDEGSTFDGWTGACNNTATSCTVTMSQAKYVDAKFNQQNTNISLTATTPVAYGSASSLAWSTSNMQNNKCDLDATYNGTSISGYPRKNLATSATNYSSGALTQNPVVFALTCTRVKGTAGPNTASATVGVLPAVMTPAPVSGTCGGTIALTYSGGTIATSYKLYRGTADQSPYTQPANPPYTHIRNTAPGAPADGSFTTLPATDAGLTPNTVYYYQVEAINTAGSSWSARPRSATASDNCFNYSLGTTGNVTLAVGSGGSTSITKTLIAGATAPVTLSVTSITAPGGTVTSGTTNTLTGSGMTVTISTTGNNNPGSPTNPASNPSTATITSTTAAQVGIYTIVVGGAPLGKTTSFTVDVGVAQPVVDAVTTTGANACGGKITLSYTGGEGATLYQLYRRINDDGTPYQLIQSAASLSALRTTDTELEYEKRYYYQVLASNGTKESYSARPKSALSTGECPPIVNLEIEQADGSYSGNTTSVVHGQSRMLRWTTTNASTCVAATIPNVPSGSVWGTNISILLPTGNHTTGPITGVDDDSQPPVREKVFRLTCQNSGGLATEVYDSVTVTITNIPTPDFSIVASPLTGVMNMYGPKGISSEFIITVEGQNNFTRDVVLDLELRTPSDQKENNVSFTLAPGDERLVFSEYSTGVGIKVNASNGLAGGKYNLIVTPLSDCNAQGQGCKKYDGTGGREDKTLSLPIQVTNVNPTFKEI